jgi:uncharacterized phage protein (TIGR02218 family)
VRSISANLDAHLAGESTTLCTCWKVTRTDATVFGFTDHVDDLVVSGTTYKAATGYRASDIVNSDDLSVDNLDIEGILDSASITEADLMAGLWDYAAVQIFRVNYKAIADGALYQRVGRLGQVRIGRTRFVAELRGLAQALGQTIGEVYTPACRADLGDTRCGVTLASYTVTGTLTGVTGRSVFADSARTEADDYFGGGKLTWTSGANNGRSMEVKSWVNSTKTFTLALPMTGTVAIGDTYSVYAGCRKRLSDCRDKFNNVVNFRGEPYVPQEVEQWQR